MKTLAILGAGTGTGLALARKYGRSGYRIALVARRSSALADLAATLRADGIVVDFFAADLTDAAALDSTLTAIELSAGTIDVLAITATSDGASFVPASELTASQLQAFLTLHTLTPVNVVQRVLPKMVERGRGSIVYINGASALGAPPRLSGPGPALAATRNFLQTLRDENASTGVVITAVFVAALIEGSAAYDAVVASGVEQTFPVIAPGHIADAAFEQEQSGTTFESILPGPLLG